MSSNGTQAHSICTITPCSSLGSLQISKKAFSQALAGDKVEALENARLAAAIQPGDAFVQFLKAVTFVLSGIPEEAFAPLDEAMRLKPIEKRAP